MDDEWNCLLQMIESFTSSERYSRRFLQPKYFDLLVDVLPLCAIPVIGIYSGSTEYDNAAFGLSKTKK